MHLTYFEPWLTYILLATFWPLLIYSGADGLKDHMHNAYVCLYNGYICPCKIFDLKLFFFPRSRLALQHKAGWPFFVLLTSKEFVLQLSLLAIGVYGGCL